MGRCRDYVGVACVDGTCPMANRAEYEERCMDVVNNCRECWMYKGCEDCALKRYRVLYRGGGVEQWQ